MRNVLLAAVAAVWLAAPAHAAIYPVFIGDLNTGTHSATDGQLSFFSSGDVFDGTPLTLNEGDTFTVTERAFQPGWSPDFASLALDFIGLWNPTTATIIATFRDLDGLSTTLSWPSGGPGVYRINTPDAPSINGSVTFSFTGGSAEFEQIDFNVVPEPATWAMMLLGFGAIGLTARSRRLKYQLA